ncbi:YcxB family protein [Kribbella sp. CA-253562]|uniref:YcxB family protein n=1 Tax=Kribbella sp. CA-253562 TaxID=3239942 RepID=UPI003D8F6EFC
MNIPLTVELTLGRRARNVRQQAHWIGWLFRTLGVGYFAWGLLARSVGMTVVAVLFLLMPEVRAVLVQYVIGRKYGRTYTYTLSGDGVRIVTAISNLEFTWAGLKSLRETRSGWRFRFPGGGGFVIPKEVFTPAQAAEWRQFLADRQLVAR